MKNCQKWMLLFAVIAVGAVLVLPQYGFQYSGLPVLIGLLMIGCCVLPMIFWMCKASVAGGGSCCGGESSCCGGKDKVLSPEEKTAQAKSTQKPSCH